MSETRFADFLERWRRDCFGVDPADESVPSVAFQQKVSALRDTEVTVHIDGRSFGTWESLPLADGPRRNNSGPVVTPLRLPADEATSLHRRGVISTVRSFLRGRRG